MNTINLQDLLSRKVTGIFYLNTELKDFTNEQSLKIISNKINLLCNEIIEKTGKAFSPVFTFSIVNEELRLSINESYGSLTNIKERAFITLIQTRDTKSNYNVLSIKSELRKWDSVKKSRNKKISLSDVKEILMPLIHMVDLITELSIKDLLRLYSTVVINTDEVITFDLYINDKGIIIKVYRNFILYQTTQIEIIK